MNQVDGTHVRSIVIDIYLSLRFLFRISVGYHTNDGE
jgi:hypothetical protein